jgi:hypothetical protein
MEERACEILCSGGCFGRYVCIWRCQNRWEGPNDWGNSVERCIDGFYALRMARFHQYLSFQLNFQLQKLVVALGRGILGDKCKVLCTKELSNGVVILIEVREDICVSVSVVGLTMVALVVVEIWGEVSPQGGI